MLQTRTLSFTLALSLLLTGQLFGQNGGEEAGVSPATDGDEASSRTVVVRMVDFAYEPSEVAVGPGDTVRFIQATKTPHNVEFREVPGDATLGDEYVVPVDEIGTRAATYPPPRMGPFLTRKEETYEFVITDAFTAGEYDFVCTPHEAMGMKGKLIVEGEGGVR